jgi:hypothetical protein
LNYKKISIANKKNTSPTFFLLSKEALEKQYNTPIAKTKKEKNNKSSGFCLSNFCL